MPPEPSHQLLILWRGAALHTAATPQALIVTQGTACLGQASNVKPSSGCRTLVPARCTSQGNT